MARFLHKNNKIKITTPIEKSQEKIAQLFLSRKSVTIASFVVVEKMHCGVGWGIEMKNKTKNLPIFKETHVKIAQIPAHVFFGGLVSED